MFTCGEYCGRCKILGKQVSFDSLKITFHRIISIDHNNYFYIFEGNSLCLLAIFTFFLCFLFLAGFLDTLGVVFFITMSFTLNILCLPQLLLSYFFLSLCLLPPETPIRHDFSSPLLKLEFLNISSLCIHHILAEISSDVSSRSCPSQILCELLTKLKLQFLCFLSSRIFILFFKNCNSLNSSLYLSFVTY